MQGQQTDPTRHMNGILVGVVAVLGDVVGNVVNHDHPVKQYDANKAE